MIFYQYIQNNSYEFPGVTTLLNMKNFEHGQISPAEEIRCIFVDI